MKFSALNVDFNGLSLDFLCSRKPAHEDTKERYSVKVVILPLLASLSWKRLHIGMGMVHLSQQALVISFSVVSTSMNIGMGMVHLSQQALVMSFSVVSTSMTLKDPKLPK